MLIGNREVTPQSKVKMDISICLDGESRIGVEWHSDGITVEDLAKMCRSECGCPFALEACPFIRQDWLDLHSGENTAPCESRTAGDWMEVLWMYHRDGERERRKQEDEWLRR